MSIIQEKADYELAREELLGLLDGWHMSYLSVSRTREEEKEWRGASKWLCTILAPHRYVRGKLYRERPELQTEYFQGAAHKKPPTLVDVVQCLLRDAEALNHDTYESWANDLGYDADSRKGVAIYEKCRAVGSKLKNMLGIDFEEAQDCANRM
jgi:hypothetical protein